MISRCLFITSSNCSTFLRIPKSVSYTHLLDGVQDMVFGLSLRMLGLVPDAEDATQEILIKVMTRLSTFRQESSLSTWVFRIAVNHLRDVRKSRFDERPLSFEHYGADIAGGREQDVGDLSGGVDRQLLEQELKYSCKMCIRDRSRRAEARR